jgi:hypothetical protein
MHRLVQSGVRAEPLCLLFRTAHASFSLPFKVANIAGSQLPWNCAAGVCGQMSQVILGELVVRCQGCRLRQQSGAVSQPRRNQVALKAHQSRASAEGNKNE